MIVDEKMCWVARNAPGARPVSSDPSIRVRLGPARPGLARPGPDKRLWRMMSMATPTFIHFLIFWFFDFYSSFSNQSIKTINLNQFEWKVKVEKKVKESWRFGYYSSRGFLNQQWLKLRSLIRLRYLMSTVSIANFTWLNVDYWLVSIPTELNRGD